MQTDQDQPAGRGYGAVLATPTAADIEVARITDFARWLAAHRQVRTDGSYAGLWNWSVADPGEFWSCVWDYFGVLGSRGAGPVLQGGPMPAVNWFAGTELSYARNALRVAAEDPARTALIYRSEAGHRGSLSYGELDEQVAVARSALASLGVGRGDRVAAYLPNSPQALVGLLAAASLGAIWTSCSPDFGSRAVIDRFAQVTPKVLIAVDGYVYGGKAYDRRAEVASIAAALPGLGSVITVDYISTGWSGVGVGVGVGGPELPVPATPWAGLADLSSRGPSDGGPSGGGPSGGGPNGRGPNGVGGSGVLRTEFTDVPFDHPLWVLYSSGTTGLPKPIVHGHGGIVLEHLKALCLHQDIGAGEVFFWYTTTGWMMWNYLVGALLAGATAVAYDGSAVHPGTSELWRLAAETGVTYFGTGAPYLVACMKAGLVPGADHDLSRLRGIGSTGSPLPPEGFDWVYAAIAPYTAAGAAAEQIPAPPSAAGAATCTDSAGAAAEQIPAPPSAAGAATCTDSAGAAAEQIPAPPSAAGAATCTDSAGAAARQPSALPPAPPSAAGAATATDSADPAGAAAERGHFAVAPATATAPRRSFVLGSFSGGTDVCTGFVGPCPLLPVRSGIIAGPCLGAKVEAFDAAGRPVVGEVGELVLTAPMPSMPVGFWGDETGERYAASYFAEYPGVWRHGDWILILPDGGCVIYGRSDATLNRGGIRMGTSEFYRVIEELPEVTDSLVIDTGTLGTEGRLMLYLVLAPGVSLDDELTARIRSLLRSALSPRHVPDEIHQVPGVPRTLSGKKLEVPVRKILTGTPVREAADRDSLANPDVLAFYAPAERPAAGQAGDER